MKEIESIWTYHQFSDLDRKILTKSARAQLYGLHYGVFCGPFTPVSYQTRYENGDIVTRPIDALDFLCYLHDKYYYNADADSKFIETFNILNKKGLLYGSYNMNGLKTLLVILRKLFFLHRYYLSKVWIT